MAPFSYKEIFSDTQTTTFYRVSISLFIQSAQQLSGINMISIYADEILADSFILSPGPLASHRCLRRCRVRYLLSALRPPHRRAWPAPVVHVDGRWNVYLLRHHCWSITDWRPYHAARRSRLLVLVQHLIRACMGLWTLPLLS